MSELEIRPERYDSSAAQGLVVAALAELATRYGGAGDETPVAPTEFAPPSGEFLVAYLDGVPAGCAGWRSHGDSGEIAELKRLFVASTARGRGIARSLLAAVEGSAREYGRLRLILECGDRQPEAIALYQRSGYERIADFGFYRDEPDVLSFGRSL
ncbi:GNAT family N-acetyltransferase [Plantactinospora soyae]|uniref:GNAT superfamily N-acetyltransferase n=1 Tax=Plantactinospora soyae TaxID=1544732 RepID=A0A927R7E9_9ACTN|nr:GNAT family N-acetyltransferase [Plantactinospora soyae]MBE1487786.1 GNAT superfamily N-acetyltransferase [Plantactinospora soyae]